jgi:hypothetical protein
MVSVSDGIRDAPRRGRAWRACLVGAHGGGVLFSRGKHHGPAPGRALRGREASAFPIPETHAVNGHRIVPPFPETMRVAVFALGCFWGVARR